MSLIVQKFGGSSVADAQKLLRSAALMRDAHDAGHDVVAVVSAQGDGTDCLLQKARELSPAPPPRELDALLATGEQASAALAAMALASLGVPAVSLCAWQAPIGGEGAHGDARIVSIGTERIRAELSRRRVVVVAGFLGVNAAGATVTLGRGGSDYSAVALAAALKAARCVIYTDVDGVYTADPRLCPTARRLSRVSYGDMLALSRAGAQVLHDKCVALARERGVEPEVRACTPDGAGTLVCAEGGNEAVVGAARSERGDGRAVVTAVGEAAPSLEKIAREALSAAGVAVLGAEVSERALSLTVPAKQSREALRAVHDALVE